LIQTNEQLLKEVTRLRRENEIMTRQQQETQQLLNDAKSALATMAMIEKEQESISVCITSHNECVIIISVLFLISSVEFRQHWQKN
jgi:hypothetical protein